MLLTRRVLISAAALLALAVWITPAVTLAEPDPSKAQAFVQDLADRATKIVSATGVSKPERDKKLRELLREGFDLNTIGQFVLGVHRRSATKEQMAAYQSEFEDFVVYTYSTRFGQYAGEELKVSGTRPAGRTDIFVSSDVVRQGKDPIPVYWRVREHKGKLAIIDVEIEGTSQALTYKQEFASVIQNRGNGLDGLIAELKEKNAKLQHEGTNKAKAE